MSSLNAAFEPFAPMASAAAARILRRFPEHEWLWRSVNHYVYHRRIQTVGRTVFGARMRLDTGDFLHKHIAYYGEWEPLFTRYLLAKDWTDRAFLDLGANIGYFSLLASQRFGQVHAVEASPQIADRLRANLELNGAGNVSVHEVAVGDRTGVIPFYAGQDDNAGCSSTLPSASRRLVCEVPMQPLASVVGEDVLARAGFIKIDVEGGELAVVRSLAASAAVLPRDVEIAMEVDPDDPNALEALGILRALGFEARILQGSYDLADYQDRSRRTALEPLGGDPEEFCDLLFRRPR